MVTFVLGAFRVSVINRPSRCDHFFAIHPCEQDAPCGSEVPLVSVINRPSRCDDAVADQGSVERTQGGSLGHQPTKQVRSQSKGLNAIPVDKSRSSTDRAGAITSDSKLAWPSAIDAGVSIINRQAGAITEQTLGVVGIVRRSRSSTDRAGAIGAITVKP